MFLEDEPRRQDRRRGTGFKKSPQNSKSSNKKKEEKKEIQNRKQSANISSPVWNDPTVPLLKSGSLQLSSGNFMMKASHQLMHTKATSAPREEIDHAKKRQKKCVK